MDWNLKDFFLPILLVYAHKPQNVSKNFVRTQKPVLISKPQHSSQFNFACPFEQVFENKLLKISKMAPKVEEYTTLWNGMKMPRVALGTWKVSNFIINYNKS